MIEKQVNVAVGPRLATRGPAERVYTTPDGESGFRMENNNALDTLCCLIGRPRQLTPTQSAIPMPLLSWIMREQAQSDGSKPEPVDERPVYQGEVSHLCSPAGQPLTLDKCLPR